MKYKSGITKEVGLAIIILLCYWLINVWFSWGNNSTKDIIELSAWILAFAIIFILVLVKSTYLVIENSKVRYVHMFLKRETVDIAKISKIEKGLVSGFFKSLLLTYSDKGKEKQMKISLVTFKKATLKQFVSDLQKQNSQIDVSQMVREIIL